MEELIEVLDSNGNKTGIIKKKSEIKRDGDFHRAISVCIINNQNEILMQQRSSNKKVFPNLWSIFVKGHVASGENSLESAKREILEELGIEIDTSELEYLYTIKEHIVTNENYIENIFFDTFLLIKDIDIKSVKLQTEEVTDAKFMYYKDIYNLINSNVMIPNIKDYELIFPIFNKLNEKKVLVKGKK